MSNPFGSPEFLNEPGVVTGGPWAFEMDEHTRILTKAPRPLPSSVVPLVWLHDDTITPIGTAWAITPLMGLFVTAEHVLMRIPGFDHKSFGDFEVKADLCGLFPTGAGTADRDLVSIEAVSRTEYSDVMLIRFDISRIPSFSADVMLGLPLNTRKPQVGMECLILGFPDGKEVPQSLGKVEKPLRVSRGPITEVFEHRRDRCMSPFPSFSIEAHAPGGMSGGPIFDHRGGVIGVYSSGHEFGDDKPDHAMGASTLAVLQLPLPNDSSGRTVGEILGPHLKSTGDPKTTLSPHPDGGWHVTWDDEESEKPS